MKFSKETVEILEAIALLNTKAPLNGVVFKPGNVIKHRRCKANMPVMHAQIPDEITDEFAIGELPKFLNVLKMMGPESQIEVKPECIQITNGIKRATIRKTRSSLVESDDEFFNKRYVLPSRDFECVITKDILMQLKSATSLFNSGEIFIRTDKSNNVFISNYNSRDKNDDKLEIKIGESELKMEVIMELDMLLFIPRDYKFTLCKRGITEWISDNIAYYTTISDKSKVE